MELYGTRRPPVRKREVSFKPAETVLGYVTGAPKGNFWKISVWKTIRDLEFSKYLL